MSTCLSCVRRLSFCASTLLFAGCSILDDRINELYPPKDTYTAQLAAVNQGLAQLEAGEDYHGLLTIKDDLFSVKIERALAEQVDGIKSVDLSMGPQELVADIEFSHLFELDENDIRDSVRLTGKARLHGIPYTEQASLFIDPFFSQVVLTSSNYYGRNIPDAFLDIVNAALGRYIANLNGALETVQVELNAQIVDEIDPADFAPSADGFVSTINSPFTVNTFLSRSSVVVSQESIKLLFGAEFEDSETFGNLIESFMSGDKGERTVDFVSAYCTQIKGLWGDLLDRQEQVEADQIYSVCRDAIEANQIHKERIRAESMSMRASLNDNRSEFDERFAEYVQKFRERQQEDVVETEPENSGFYLTKAFISDLVNTTAETASFSFKYAAPQRSANFNEKIEIDRAPDLNCGAGIDCDARLPNCDRRCDISCWSRRNCSFGCRWYQLDCHARKLDCERIRFQDNAACTIRRGSCEVGCRSEWLAKKTACEAEEVARRLGCELNQAWLDLFSGADIGRVSGTATLHDSFAEIHYGHQPGRYLSVAEDLTSARLNIGLIGYGRATIDLKFTPLDIGHAICIAQWSGTLRSRFTGVMNDHNGIEGAITSSQAADGVVLNIATGPQTFEIELAESPLFDLFRQNPQAVVACAPLAALGVTAKFLGELEPVILGSTDLQDLQTKFDLDVDGFNIPLVLDKIEMEVNVENESEGPEIFTLVPVWSADSKALGYIVE